MTFVIRLHHLKFFFQDEPPVFDTKGLRLRTNRFANFKEYCNIFYPLLMHELWANVFKDYMQNKGYSINLKAMLYPQIENIDHRLVKLHFVSVITHNEKRNESNMPSEGWFVEIILRYTLFFDKHIFFKLPRGQSLLESWVTTFLPDWQPPLIFVWFTSKSHEH